MPFWERCCYPNQGRGGREAFSLLIVKFYCSRERLLANHTTRRRSPRALVPSGLCRGEAKPPALPGARVPRCRPNSLSSRSARWGGQGRS